MKSQRMDNLLLRFGVVVRNGLSLALFFCQTTSNKFQFLKCMLHVQLDYLFSSQSTMAPICRAVDVFAVAVAVYLALDILDVQSGLLNSHQYPHWTR